MKRLIFLLMLPLALISCSDNDEEEDNPLVGTWKYLDFSYTNFETNNEDFTAFFMTVIDYNREKINAELDVTLTFTANKKFIFASSEEIGEGTYSIEGNKITMVVPGKGSTTSEFVISENKFTTYADMTLQYKELYESESDIEIYKVVMSATYIKVE
jgi:hypothetical protein